MIFPNGKPRCDDCCAPHENCTCKGYIQCSAAACEACLNEEDFAQARAAGEFLFKYTWYCAYHRADHFCYRTRYPWDDELVEDMNRNCFEKMTPAKQKAFCKDRTIHYARMYGILDHPYKNCVSSSGDDTPRYFLTFTYNGNHEKQTWLDAVKLRLGRKDIKRFISGVVEHPESNIHVHAYVESDKNWTTNRTKKTYPFHSFEKNYGHVDVKRVKNDNGISDYIQTGKVEKIEELKLAI